MISSTLGITSGANSNGIDALSSGLSRCTICAVEYARDGVRCVVVRVESRAWYPNRDAAVVVDDDDDDDDVVVASTAAHAIARVADDDDDAVAFDASARAARRATNIVVEQWRSIDRRRDRGRVALNPCARVSHIQVIYNLRLCPWYKYMR